MRIRLVVVVLVIGVLVGICWAQTDNTVHRLWLEKTAGQPPDVISSTICWWYLSSLHGMASQAEVVAVCKVAAVTPLNQRLRPEFDYPDWLARYTPWLPPTMEPADTAATIQVEEALIGCQDGDNLYVLGSAQQPVSVPDACHPQFVQGERVLLFLREVEEQQVVPGAAYAVVSGLSGAWPVQWPDQQVNPMWERDGEAVRAVCGSLALAPDEQLTQWQEWAQSDNLMLRIQAVICSIAMEQEAQRQVVRQGFGWEYTRYAALCLIWLANEPGLDEMVEAQFTTFPDSIGWMSLKIALPVIDRNWARHRQGGE